MAGKRGFSEDGMVEGEVAKCFIMLCNNRTERECIGRGLFGDRKWRLDYLKEIGQGNVGYLLNTTRNELIGVFEARSEVQLDIEKDAWGGDFRAQVRVEAIGDLKRLGEASSVLANAGVALVNLPSGALVPLLSVQNRDIAKKILECFEKKQVE